VSGVILALLLQATPCKATTDVPELKAGISRACRPGLVSIDISGDHETLTETLVLDKDLGGRDLSEVVGDGAADGTAGMTTATLRGFHAAMESARIMEQLYHSRRFIWKVRDREDRPICFFEVTDDETTGRCAEKP
jgi:hypothetical protein